MCRYVSDGDAFLQSEALAKKWRSQRSRVI